MSVTVLAARNYKHDSRIATDVMFDFDALDEVLSLADHRQVEATSLASSCWPEVTRPEDRVEQWLSRDLVIEC